MRLLWKCETLQLFCRGKKKEINVCMHTPAVFIFSCEYTHSLCERKMKMEEKDQLKKLIDALELTM